MNNIRKKILKLSVGFAAIAAITVGSTVAIISCSTEFSSKYRPWGTYQLVSDYGSVQDKSFNQGVWNGLVAWANKDNTMALPGIITSENETIGYTQATKANRAQMRKAYLTAINNGAKYLVLPGFKHGAFSEGDIDEFLKDYPNVRAVGIDTNANPDYNETGKVIHVNFNTEQSGFLTAVAIGVFCNSPNKNGGFQVNGNTIRVATFGGLPFKSVTSYMDGFLQGADWFNKQATSAQKKFELVRETKDFSGTFDVGDAINLAKSYSADNVQFVLPVAGGQTGDVITVIKSEAKVGKMFAIGVDTEQSELYGKEYVLGSQMKGLSKATISVIENFNKLNTKPTINFSLKDGTSYNPEEMYVGFAFNPTFRSAFADDPVIKAATEYATPKDQEESKVLGICYNKFGKFAASDKEYAALTEQQKNNCNLPNINF